MKVSEFFPLQKKIAAIPVTSRGGPWGCQTSKLPHFLDNRHTDGGEVASLNVLTGLYPTPGRFLVGRAIVQAVSRWLLTAAARVRVRPTCGVCCGESSTRAGFLRVLRFPLPIIPPISPSS
jgi:hypothetical protein